jgi:hypothetical protein
MLFSNNIVVKNLKFDIFMNFNNANENRPDLTFPLERVTNNSTTTAIRFLGVYFDENLTFKYHINLIASKLSKALALRTSKTFLQRKLVKLYTTHCSIVIF